MSAVPDLAPLCAHQREQLEQYVALLQRWNQTYNLTAVREAAQIWTHHVQDCLAVVAPLRRELGGCVGRRLLDVGSGAGLPGVILAIAEPDLRVTCVDAVGKKAAFVKQVASELGLAHLVSLHARVEDLKGEAAFDVISSRAFSALNDFVRLTGSQLAANGKWLAMKGKVPAAEIAALPADVQLFHLEQLMVPALEGERCLVWMGRRDEGRP